MDLVEIEIEGMTDKRYNDDREASLWEARDMHAGEMTKLTEISARQWDYVTQDNLSAKEAVAFLLESMQTRVFQDVLNLVCPKENAEKQLVEGLLQQSGQSQPDSVRRKVRNWMAGKTLPTEREDVFRICFALQLTQEQADRMLSLLTEQGIHYRNGREMIYAYCLRCGLTYDYACALVDRMLGGSEDSRAQRDPMTQMMRSEFMQVRAEEDLFDFILRHKQSMGTQHNTAYAYFEKMLGLLTGEDMDGEAQYSMEYVADTYLRMNVPEDKKTAKYNDVQKMVKKYWPGTKSIKAMHARSEDVTRKALLLLYLVTGGEQDGEYDELDESYIEPREFLETHCKRMNRMLMDCGMRRIDPRSVFDCLVLYCLRPQDEEFMSDRMAAAAEELFGTDET